MILIHRRHQINTPAFKTLYIMTLWSKRFLSAIHLILIDNMYRLCDYIVYTFFMVILYSFEVLADLEVS